MWRGRRRTLLDSDFSRSRRKQRSLESLEARHLLAANVVINEIHYDSEIKTELVEFVELHNGGDTDADISNWFFSDGIDYVFPENTTLPAGGYLLVSQSPSAVQTKFGVSSFGPFDGRLSNEGERIQLRDSNNTVVDEVDYGIGFPWPIVGDGNSIELVHPDLDNNLGGSWRTSAGIAATSDDLIAPESTWKYWKGTSEPSVPISAYRTIGFDDSAWSIGQTPIGYGEGFINTNLADMRNGYSTFYMRRDFNVDDPAEIGSLLLQVRYDDGILVWINGSLVANANVANRGLTNTDTANSAIENTEFVSFELDNPVYLQSGVNVISALVLNASLGGSSGRVLRCSARCKPGRRGRHITC